MEKERIYDDEFISNQADYYDRFEMNYLFELLDKYVKANNVNKCLVMIKAIKHKIKWRLK